QGKRIGWVDGTDLYLQPDAAFAEAQGLARDQGEALPVAPRTLWKRLREKGALASWDEKRMRNPGRRTLEGRKDRDVLHLPADALSTCSEPSESSANSPDCQESRVRRTVQADSAADGDSQAGENRPPPPSANPASHSENSKNSVPGGRFGQSATGADGLPA